MTMTNDEAADYFEFANDGQGPDVVAELDPADADALISARRSAIAAEAALTASVASARRHGATWQAIGAILGISRQAAHAKYSKVA